MKWYCKFLHFIKQCLPFFKSELETLSNNKLLRKNQEFTPRIIQLIKQAYEHSFVQNTIGSNFYAMASIACLSFIVGSLSIPLLVFG